MAPSLVADYPWTSSPLIALAPMRLIATAPLATAVSLAGGLGFLGAGYDFSDLAAQLAHAADLLAPTPLAIPPPSSLIAKPLLPIGIGIILHSASLPSFLSILRSAPHTPAAIWLFAPARASTLAEWTHALRDLYHPHPAPRIWIQIGSVADAVSAAKTCAPDVLVVQGGDAGGHGLAGAAGVVALLPEVFDAVAAAVAAGEAERVPALVGAGGIVEGRGVAAAVALGAEGAVLGTRFLASHEAEIARGYKDEVVRAVDGGKSTVRTRLYDSLRGTHGWPAEYGGRGVVNRSWWDAEGGMGMEENTRRYNEALKTGEDAGWGVEGRMTTYAGTAVGLVRGVSPAGEITREVREGANRVLSGLLGRL